jgi:hypothetical protein
MIIKVVWKDIFHSVLHYHVKLYDIFCSRWPVEHAPEVWRICHGTPVCNKIRTFLKKCKKTNGKNYYTTYKISKMVHKYHLAVMKIDVHTYVRSGLNCRPLHHDLQWPTVSKIDVSKVWRRFGTHKWISESWYYAVSCFVLVICTFQFF